MRDRIMSAAWSEHFEDDTICVVCLKGQSDIILNLEPIKADFVDEVSTAPPPSLDTFLRQDINTGFLNRFGSVSQF